MNDKLLGQSFSSLPRSKKTALIFLLIIAIAIFVTWFWQFNSRLHNPFIVKPNAQDLAKIDKLNTQTISKVTDTDHDGLSDFDESNVYKTSPYLEDTDGDGIPDGTEVKNATNPLCPEGQDCSQTSQTATSTAIATSTIKTPGSSVDEALLIQALSGAGDAASLRILLLQGGANKASLDKISDADLMASYKEVLQAQNPAALEVINSTSTATTTINQ